MAGAAARVRARGKKRGKARAAFDQQKHPRSPKGQPGGGRFSASKKPETPQQRWRRRRNKWVRSLTPDEAKVWAKAFYGRLWKMVAPYYGAKGQPPPEVIFTDNIPDGRNGQMVIGPDGVRHIELNTVAIGNLLRGRLGRGYGSALPIHEWRHFFQSVDLLSAGPDLPHDQRPAEQDAFRFTKKVQGSILRHQRRRKRRKVSKAAARNAQRDKVEGVSKFATFIGKALGVDPDKVEEAMREDQVEKSATTFAEQMAQRELDNELPDAMSVLRSVIFRAFNPYPEDTNVDPKKVISDSLDQFKDWALGLVDRTQGDSVQKAEVEEMIGKAVLLEKAVLDAAARNKLPDSAFALPGRRYPIHDLAHARNALARSAGKPEEKKVRAAVEAKFPQLKGSKVEKADGPNSDFATVGNVELDDLIGSGDEASLEDRVADIEEAVSKLTPENIAKAMKNLAKGEGEGNGGGDGGGTEPGEGGTEPAPETGTEPGEGDGAGNGGSEPAPGAQASQADLEKKIGEIADKAVEDVQKLQARIDKLAAGGSSQSGDDGDPERVEKAEAEKIAKAYEAEGVDPALKGML